MSTALIVINFYMDRNVSMPGKMFECVFFCLTAVTFSYS